MIILKENNFESFCTKHDKSCLGVVDCRKKLLYNFKCGHLILKKRDKFKIKLEPKEKI